jgi:thiol-disulfide isomerase/thioredoxin
LYAQCMLAEWILEMRNGRLALEERLVEISRGAALRHPREPAHCADILATTIPADRIPALVKEAEELLGLVASSDSNARTLAPINKDKDWDIIEVDQKRPESRPMIRDIANGLLFKEQHLRVGKPAPELEVKLVDGATPWSISANLGKVLIIQFSHKGCGPCEEMYPVLRRLKKLFPETLSILSVMTDQDVADTTDAVESGKLDWNVVWDGARGPIGTRWSVRRFPTVYVIGRNGIVAGVDLRDDELSDIIAQLVNKEKQ